jgi:hypothetical protein
MKNAILLLTLLSATTVIAHSGSVDAGAYLKIPGGEIFSAAPHIEIPEVHIRLEIPIVELISADDIYIRYYASFCVDDLPPKALNLSPAVWDSIMCSFVVFGQPRIWNKLALNYKFQIPDPIPSSICFYDKNTYKGRTYIHTFWKDGDFTNFVSGDFNL